MHRRAPQFSRHLRSPGVATRPRLAGPHASILQPSSRATTCHTRGRQGCPSAPHQHQEHRVLRPKRFIAAHARVSLLRVCQSHVLLRTRRCYFMPARKRRSINGAANIEKASHVKHARQSTQVRERTHNRSFHPARRSRHRQLEYRQLGHRQPGHRQPLCHPCTLC